jgi:hypothetical protein
MMAVRTTIRFPGLGGHRTAFDPKGLPIDKGIGDLPACRFNNSTEGLPRNVHPGSSLLLIQPIEIGQPQ